MRDSSHFIISLSVHICIIYLSMNAVESLPSSVLPLQRRSVGDSSSFCPQLNVHTESTNLCNVRDSDEQSQTEECNSNNPYRNIDGRCNNLKHPKWGASGTCYMRILPASYEGQHEFRKSVTGNDLPNPRVLSQNINPDVRKSSPLVSSMFNVFGQFVAHDTTRAPFRKLHCCDLPDKMTSSCGPIPIRSNDTFYSQFNVTCVVLSRTLVGSPPNADKAEQLNVQTSFIDTSMVYGATTEKMNEIRRRDGSGKLTSEESTTGSELLPSGKDPEDILCKTPDSKCFRSGDPRVNMHAALSSIQTLFMREHNRIAGVLRTQNPHWEEEKLFQEARRIVIAQEQCIAYKEYLPSLLGSDLMDQFSLWMDREGKNGSTYNPDTNPTVWNEFGAALFRIHSMIPSHIGLDNVRLRDAYSNPDILRNGHMEALMKGACAVHSRKFSRFYTTDLTNHLNQNPGLPYGMDMAAQDIQRGRDHGMPPYVHFLNFCSSAKKNITSFDDLSELMSKESIQLLKQNYESLEDVDLIVGSQLEHKVPGSLLGYSAAYVAAVQFAKLKFGDRFFWENRNQVTSFTPAQLETLRGCSLSRVLCDNAPQEITSIQRNALLIESFENPILSCKALPPLDLTQWTEN